MGFEESPDRLAKVIYVVCLTVKWPCVRTEEVAPHDRLERACPVASPPQLSELRASSVVPVGNACELETASGTGWLTVGAWSRCVAVTKFKSLLPVFQK